MPQLCELSEGEFLTMSGDYLLIKAEETPKVTPGGIMLPDGTRRTFQQRRGIIVNAGPGVYTMSGAFVATTRAVGQRVCVNPMAPAMDVKLGRDEYFVVRDNDGLPQVLINSCRHRGNAVCRAEEGHATSFMCTYHGWTYDLKGNLIGVPFRRGVKADGKVQGGMPADFDNAAHGMTRLRAVERNGVVWASFAHDAPSFEAYADRMLPMLDRLYDFHSFEIIPRLGQAVAGDKATAVTVTGSEPVTSLQITARDAEAAAALPELLRAGGFPADESGTFASADPGRPAIVRVVVG